MPPSFPRSPCIPPLPGVPAVFSACTGLYSASHYTHHTYMSRMHASSRRRLQPASQPAALQVCIPARLSVRTALLAAVALLLAAGSVPAAAVLETAGDAAFHIEMFWNVKGGENFFFSCSNGTLYVSDCCSHESRRRRHSRRQQLTSAGSNDATASGTQAHT